MFVRTYHIYGKIYKIMTTCKLRTFSHISNTYVPVDLLKVDGHRERNHQNISQQVEEAYHDRI